MNIQQEINPNSQMMLSLDEINGKLKEAIDLEMWDEALLLQQDQHSQLVTLADAFQSGSCVQGDFVKAASQTLEINQELMTAAKASKNEVANQLKGLQLGKTAIEAYQ